MLKSLEKYRQNSDLKSLNLRAVSLCRFLIMMDQGRQRKCVLDVTLYQTLNKLQTTVTVSELRTRKEKIKAALLLTVSIFLNLQTAK